MTVCLFVLYTEELYSVLTLIPFKEKGNWIFKTSLDYLNVGVNFFITVHLLSKQEQERTNCLFLYLTTTTTPTHKVHLYRKNPRYR